MPNNYLLQCGGKHCVRPVIKVRFAEKDQWYHADYLGLKGVPNPSSSACAKPKGTDHA